MKSLSVNKVAKIHSFFWPLHGDELPVSVNILQDFRSTVFLSEAGFDKRAIHLLQ